MFSSCNLQPWIVTLDCFEHVNKHTHIAFSGCYTDGLSFVLQHLTSFTLSCGYVHLSQQRFSKGFEMKTYSSLRNTSPVNMVTDSRLFYNVPTANTSLKRLHKHYNIYWSFITEPTLMCHQIYRQTSCTKLEVFTDYFTMSSTRSTS